MILNFFELEMDSEKAAKQKEDTEDYVEEEEDCCVAELGCQTNSEAERKSKCQLTSAVLRNPQVLAALQSRINSIVGQPSDYIQVHGHARLFFYIS